MTSSNKNIFRVTGYLCGKFTGHRRISRTKASNAELWGFFDLRLTRRLSKQWWGWWFETPSCPLWCHRNEKLCSYYELTKDTPYLALKGELWDVLSGFFGENKPQDIESALFLKNNCYHSYKDTQSILIDPLLRCFDVWDWWWRWKWWWWYLTLF